MDGLYRQKLWYKLLFEGHKGKKETESCGGADFGRMYELGKWTGVVNFSLVNTYDHPEKEEFYEPREKRSD